MATDPAIDRDKLKVDADVLRARLARALEALGQRERKVVEAVDVKHQVEKHPLSTALIGAGALAVAGGTGLYAYSKRRRRKQRAAERLAALVRAWQHPEQLARRSGGSIHTEILRGVIVGLATFVLERLAKRELLGLFPQLGRERSHSPPAPPASRPA